MPTNSADQLHRRIAANYPTAHRSLTEINRTCVFLAAMLCLLFWGCSKPPQLTIYNDQTERIVMEFSDGRRKSIGPGRSITFSFVSLEPGALVFSGARHTYRWRTVPPDLADRSKYPVRFAFALKSDGNLHAMRAVGRGLDELLAVQPSGFPLTPTATPVLAR